MLNDSNSCSLPGINGLIFYRTTLASVTPVCGQCGEPGACPPVNREQPQPNARGCHHSWLGRGQLYPAPPPSLIYGACFPTYEHTLGVFDSYLYSDWTVWSLVEFKQQSLY
ncbi:hypothetical protein J6590_028560 [Homalodisca vitripennis]|nr:hypothetical protein J6590_028560 [Homalodisca vitripennis]